MNYGGPIGCLTRSRYLGGPSSNPVQPRRVVLASAVGRKIGVALGAATADGVSLPSRRREPGKLPQRRILALALKLFILEVRTRRQPEIMQRFPCQREGKRRPVGPSGPIARIGRSREAAYPRRMTNGRRAHGRVSEFTKQGTEREGKSVSNLRTDSVGLAVRVTPWAGAFGWPSGFVAHHDRVREGLPTGL